jgi:serine/threonine-protein kinase
VLPDLPLALSDLLERLLAKDREARPHDAQEVIDALAQIEIRDTSPRFLGSVSDLQTGATTVDLLKVKALTRPPDAGGRSARFPRRVGWIAALLALAVAGAAAVYWARTAAVKPLRVAILPFELRPAGGRLDLAASGVMSSLLGSLSSLRGLAVVDPTQTRGNTPVEVAHILGADEVVAVTLESAEGTTARVTLRRVQGGDGQVLKSVTFQVPTDPDGLYSLAEGVASQVRSVYSGFALLPDAPRLEVRPEDYAVFVQAQSDLDSGRISVLPARARLEPILITSPHFLEARLLGVDLNFSLWRTGQDPGGLDKARELARQAEKIAPGDPRVLLCELKVALADGRSQAAEDLLDRFEALRPGDPEILARRAELVDRLGRLDEALAMQRTVASRVPSWKNLFYLARLEARSGHIEEARATLETLTRQAPRNFWVEMEVGDFELRNGDPARAEAIFQRLDTGRPPLSVLINLGFSRYLLGRYREAVAVYQRAAEISPENPDVLINLADAETEAGDLAAAAAHYRRLLKNLEAAAERGPGVGNDLLRAQCLARLGRGGEAVDLVQRVLRQNPTDVDSFYYAALVDALAGDRNAALSNAREALLRGCSPRWFDISAFASLREEPEIQTLLKRRRTSPATRIGPDRATESSPSRSSPH